MSSVINLFNVAYMCSGRRTRNISRVRYTPALDQDHCIHQIHQT